jgi:3-oxoacyl-[acyl-carrier-protein] synthase-3
VLLILLGDTTWAFSGQEIFKKAVTGMVQASEKTLEKSGLRIEDIDLIVPHQAMQYKRGWS